MSGLHAISPNQFALPGMEHLAHPFAPHVANGLMASYHAPGGNWGEHEHAIRAHFPHQDPLDYHSIIQWNDKSADHNYPGEVQWVESGNAYGGAGKHRGVARSLFNLAHETDFGQDTVPVHSPHRTDDGEAFSKKVRPDLAPPRYIDSEHGRHMNPAAVRAANEKSGAWEPPEGIHPYEQQAQQRQGAKVERNVQQERRRKMQPRLSGWEGASVPRKGVR